MRLCEVRLGVERLANAEAKGWGKGLTERQRPAPPAGGQTRALTKTRANYPAGMQLFIYLVVWNYSYRMVIILAIIHTERREKRAFFLPRMKSVIAQQFQKKIYVL